MSSDHDESDAIDSGEQGWYGIPEACAYLQISDQTMFRWMRNGKISYYKVGKSTRFKQEDRDRMVEKVVSQAEGEVAGNRCAVCGHSRLVEGAIQSTGKIFFKPQKTKFWVWADSSVPVQASCCPVCGHIQLRADTEKLEKLDPDEE